MSGAVVNTVENTGLYFKIACFLFSCLPLVGFIKFLFKHKKEDKNYFYLYLLTIIFVGILPMFVERVNLMWHTGSYQSFPWRFGFIPLFVIFSGAMRYFTYYEENKKDESNKIIFIKVLISTILIVLIGFISPKLINSIQNTSDSAFNVHNDSIEYMAIIGVSLFIIENIILKIKNEDLKNIFLKLAIGSQIIIFGISYLGCYEAKQNLDASKYKSEISTNYEDNYRMKIDNYYMFQNYGWILDVPTIDQMTNLISNSTRDTLKNLGYLCLNGTTTGVGGTVFSDNVLGVKYVLSQNKLDNYIYNLKEKIEPQLYLYEVKQSLPLGIIYQSDENLEKLPSETNVFENQNYLYKNLFGNNNDILENSKKNNRKLDNCIVYENGESIYIEKINQEEKASIEYDITSKENSILYMHINTDKENPISAIKVNNVNVLNLKSLSTYGSGDSNQILNLGKYNKKSDLKVKIEFNNNTSINSINFANLNLDEYNKMFQQKQENKLIIDKNKITANIEANENEKLFIPISYDESWKIKVNEKEATKNKVFGGFLSINLESGNNNIEMIYEPQFLKQGIIISFSVLILLIAMYFINKKTHFTDNKYLLNISTILATIFYIFVLYEVYIITIIKTFTNDIFK